MNNCLKSVTSYSVGDPVVVNDAEGTYTGIVIGTINDQALSVQMIKKHKDGIYRTSADAFEVPLYAITEHKPLDSDDDAPKAFDELGFRMLDGESFVRHEDELTGMSVPIGELSYEIPSDEESESESMKDFIVSDSECEPFTLASNDSQFVQDTHRAVNEFNDWIPQTPKEEQTRQFIIQQEARAVAIDDNTRFAQNLPGESTYSRPPV